MDKNIGGYGPFEIMLEFDIYKIPEKLSLEAKNIKCLGPKYKSKNSHKANNEGLSIFNNKPVQEKLDWNMENEN